MFIHVLSIIFLLIIHETLFAEIKIFLFPRIEIEDDNIAIRDIAVIDGSSLSLDKIGKIEITKELYGDGYLDRKELGILLRKNIRDTVFIYGNAVRIFRRIEAKDNEEEISDDGEIVVKAGERVSLIIKKKGITVELLGTVVEEGRQGEDIKVKLKDFRVVRGRLKKRRLVEVTL